ncbi:response regulator [Candidatus Curtissbacteria bacterium]|nr:response regulator [Candidatus Curtissbacteria bacterium]
MATRILLIEDDQLVREAYEEALRGEGFDVEIAADGQEGLNKARLGGYSIILLDMMLPKIDGLGILRGLRQEPPQVKNGPVLLLTNLSHDPVINQAMDLGASAALIKSDIDPGLLIESIKAYVAAGGTDGAAGGA